MVKILKRYFGKFYTEDDVKVFVKSGDITPEQFEEITGVMYSE